METGRVWGAARRNTDKENKRLEGAPSEWLKCQGRWPRGIPFAELPCRSPGEELQMRDNTAFLHSPGQGLFLFFTHMHTYAGFIPTYESSKACRETSVFDISFFLAAGWLSF